MIYIVDYEGSKIITITDATPQELALLRKAQSLADLYNDSWNNFQGTNLYGRGDCEKDEEKEEGT